MPRRKISTHTMTMRPVAIVTGKSEVASMFCRLTTRPAPTAGPTMVPMPPSRVIRVPAPAPAPGRGATRGPDAAEQGHQDPLARHLPPDVGQGRELEHQRLDRARQ